MVATSISGVATVFFDLVFDPAILKFTSGSVGPFLASAGGAIDFQAALDTVPGNAPGHLVVSVTLTPATSSVSGSGTLCSFTFTGIVSGTSTLTVANTGVLTPVPQQGIPGIAFPGGTVTVRH